MREADAAHLVAHRHNRLLEAAFLPGLRRTALALDGKGVHVIAAEAVFGGDRVGADALRREVGLEGDLRIG